MGSDADLPVIRNMCAIIVHSSGKADMEGGKPPEGSIIAPTGFCESGLHDPGRER